VIARATIAAVSCGALVGCRGEPPPQPPPPLPACSPPAPTRSGEATFYDPFVPKGEVQCGLPLGADRFVAAINTADYAGSSSCGSCLVVVGPDGDEVLVRVVDRCPGCKPGGLDLSREAFALLAPHAAGRIPIRWLPVPCAVDGTLAYHFKTGSNPFWTAIQARNHRYAIATLAARDAGGAFQPLVRTDYNYFVGQNLGPGPYALRITDARGHSLDDTGITLGSGVERAGSAQAPPCP
jgi:expansin